MNSGPSDETLIMPEELRPVLRRPLGRLFMSMGELLGFLSNKRPPLTVAVGDRTSWEMIKNGLEPDVIVVDLKEMRKPVGEHARETLMSFGKSEVRVSNPAGTITPGLIAAMANAGKKTRIIVNGEEDLSVLPAVLLLPLGTVIVYGQPKEGIVFVEVTPEKKDEIAGILKKFKRGP